MKTFVSSKYIKEDNKFKASSRKITSFYSSLIAGIFVATSFIFISYFVPFGEKSWYWNWLKFTPVILIYCFIYYVIGFMIIKSMNPKEVPGFNNNFLASFIATFYISAIILLRLKFLSTLIITVILSFISLWICHRIASRKYHFKDKLYDNIKK